MSEIETTFTGGCLCGAVRYEAVGEPAFAGHCYCNDCRKASGSGFIPFIGFTKDAIRFSGETLVYRSPATNGREAARNSCPSCGSLVFGGVRGESDGHTIYAGTLDDPSLFKPSIAIFTASRPAWAPLPPHLTAFEGPPGG